MTFKSYYKLPAAQTSEENCVAHNGSLIPIPGPRRHGAGLVSGRHLGLRLDGRVEPEGDRVLRPRPDGRDEARGRRLVVGVLVQRLHRQLRDLARARHLRAACRAASCRRTRSTRRRRCTSTTSTRRVSRSSCGRRRSRCARAYLDQLERNNGLAADKIASTRAELAAAEKLSGQAKKDALTKLSQQLHTDARSAGDQPKAHKLAFAVGDLAK